MSNKNDYFLKRVLLVQTYDAIYYEEGNHSKCHKRLWNRACGLFCISYSTYLNYLKRDTSGVPPLNSIEIDTLVDFAAKLDANRRKILSRDFYH